MTLRPRVFAPLSIPGRPEDPAEPDRVDITVSGLDHSGLSYELRIFLENPTADAGTPPTPEAGYAGSIHVYGYGQPPPAGPDDAETRIRLPRSIIATDAIRAQAAGEGPLSVTLVPIAVGEAEADVDLDEAGVSVRLDAGGGGGV